jgi:site-specific DNA recombinase
MVKAAVEGRLPRGIGVTRLRDAPAARSRQYAMLISSMLQARYL